MSKRKFEETSESESGRLARSKYRLDLVDSSIIDYRNKLKHELKRIFEALPPSSDRRMPSSDFIRALSAVNLWPAEGEHDKVRERREVCDRYLVCIPGTETQPMSFRWRDRDAATLKRNEELKGELATAEYRLHTTAASLELERKRARDLQASLSTLEFEQMELKADKDKFVVLFNEANKNKKGQEEREEVELALNAKINDLLQQLSDKGQKLRNLDLLVLDQKTRLDSLSAVIDRLEKQAEDAKACMKRAEMEFAKEKEQWAEQKNGLEKDLQCMSDENEQLVQNAEAAEKDWEAKALAAREETARTMKDLESELGRMKGIVGAEMVALGPAVKAQDAAKEKEIADLKAEVALMEMEKKAAEDNAENMEDEITKLNGLVEEKDTLFKALVDEVSGLKKAKMEDAKMLKELELELDAEHEDAEDKLLEKNQEQAAMLKEREELEEQLEEKEAAIKKLTGKVAAMETDLDNARSDAQCNDDLFTASEMELKEARDPSTVPDFAGRLDLQRGDLIAIAGTHSDHGGDYWLGEVRQVRGQQVQVEYMEEVKDGGYKVWQAGKPDWISTNYCIAKIGRIPLFPKEREQLQARLRGLVVADP